MSLDLHAVKWNVLVTLVIPMDMQVLGVQGRRKNFVRKT